MKDGWLQVAAELRGSASRGNLLRSAFAPMYEGQTSFWDLHETLTVKHGLALWQIYPLHARWHRSGRLGRRVVAARGCACIDAAVSDLHHAGLSAALCGSIRFRPIHN